MAVVPDPVSGGDLLVYQNPLGDLMALNASDPGSEKPLLDASEVLNGSALATASFRANLLFPGLEPPGVGGTKFTRPRRLCVCR
jgi:hypothetical protein